jgi:hypothetical protein
MKKIDYKVEGGKLLRVQANIKGGIIRDIKIRGDFFVYPETAIFKIEDFLKGCNIKTFNDPLSKYLKEENIIIIGFGVSDLKKSLYLAS